MNKPFLGNDIPHRDNKCRVKHLHFDRSTNLYVIQATVLGVRKHIACFHDFQEAKEFADKMHTFDLSDPEQVEDFLEMARSVFQNEKTNHTRTHERA